MLKLQQIIVKNWKTSLCGGVALIAHFVVFSHTMQNEPLYYRLAAWIASGGVSAGLLLARDWDQM